MYCMVLYGVVFLHRKEIRDEYREFKIADA